MCWQGEELLSNSSLSKMVVAPPEMSVFSLWKMASFAKLAILPKTLSTLLIPQKFLCQIWHVSLVKENCHSLQNFPPSTKSSLTLEVNCTGKQHVCKDNIEVMQATIQS